MQRLPNFVIFGPQRNLPDPETLSRLRLVTISEPKLTAAIRDLPRFWCALVQSLPELHGSPGLKVLQELKSWIDHGHLPPPSQPLPNVLLTPLSILSDIANYLHGLRGLFTDQIDGHAAILESAGEYGGFYGLCTGLLSAIAVACSKEQNQIGDFGTVALRLAVCVGAIVDVEGAFRVPPDEACCLNMRSRFEDESKMMKILQGFPEVSQCPRVGSSVHWSLC